MEIAGLCSICNKGTRTLYTCWRCGARVCFNCYGLESKLCALCLQEGK